jgi:MFS superfamily sulfate permease-like transporter
VKPQGGSSGDLFAGLVVALALVPEAIKNLRDHPRSSSIVMIVAVLAVIYTHNLAIGVLADVYGAPGG